MKRSLLKKLIVLTLSIAILLNALPLMVASAAETATVTAAADKSSYAVGDTVVVDVAVSEVTVKSIGLSWTYDDAVLEFVSATWALTGVIADVEEEAPRAAFAYDEATATAGKIFTLTFTVLKDAEDTSVVVTPVLKNGTTVIEVAAAVATVSFACKHENIGDWEKDATNHWKSCECGEVLDEGTHVFANACDVDCDTCGYTREVDGHVYDNDCDATCNTCGETRMVGDHVYDNACDATCNSCGEEREVGDHEYSDWQNVEEGHFKVCTECSNQTATEPHVYDNDCDFDCNVCGATRNVDGHQFSETYENDETGHWYECTTCGEKTDVLPHVFDNACDATCNDCGYIREVADHDFGEFQYNDVTHWKECSVCGTISEEGDHVFGEWETDVEATKTTTGSKHRECICGKTETKVIPQILRLSNASLSLSSNIMFQFKTEGATLDTYGYTDPYLEFNYTNKDGSPATSIVSEYKKGSDGKYVFEFSEFAPDMMGDNLYVTLNAKYDGEDYVSVVVEYSVLKYCNSQFAKNISAELRTLLVDMLNYGASLQIYNTYKIDALVNAGLTEEQKSWASTTCASFENQQSQSADIDNALVAFKSVGLTLSDSIIVTSEFVANDFTGLELHVTCNNETVIYNVAEEYANEEDGKIKFSQIKNGETRYRLFIDYLGANTVRKPITIVAMKDGQVVSRVLTYSVQTYAYKNAGDTAADLNLKNLLIDMMKYGDAVLSYRLSLGYTN